MEPNTLEKLSLIEDFYRCKVQKNSMVKYLVNYGLNEQTFYTLRFITLFTLLTSIRPLLSDFQIRLLSWCLPGKRKHRGESFCIWVTNITFLFCFP